MEKRFTGWMIGGLAALVLAGCAGRTPEPTSVTQASAGPEASAERPAQDVVVAGTVFYVERIALSPRAILQVEVVEDGSTVVGEQTVSAPGQVPLPFSVAVPAQRVRPEARYTVRASIVDGERRYSTPEPVPVLTQGHPSEDVRVRVRPGG